LGRVLTHDDLLSEISNKRARKAIRLKSSVLII
jgi:hypothetical protein